MNCSALFIRGSLATRLTIASGVCAQSEVFSRQRKMILAAILMNNLAIDDSAYCFSCHLTAMKRRVAAFRTGLCDIKRPTAFGIQNRHVRVAALKHSPRCDAHDFLWIDRKHFNHPADRQLKFRKCESNRRLQARDTKWRAIEFQHLQIRMMRRVVAGNYIDGPVRYTLAKGIDIVL